MIASIIAIAAYVLGSLGFYGIATRRGIRHAWIAWVPIANGWLLGCISDQYQSVKFGKEKKKRIILLVLNILYGLSIAVMVVLCITMIVQMVIADGGLDFNDPTAGYFPEDSYVEMLPSDPYGAEVEEELPEELMGPLFGMIGAYAVMLLTFLPMMIVQYMALYDVFRSCDPSSSVLFLLLSIFLGISSFLVFACKDKDYGMPPRQTAQPACDPWQPPYGGPGDQPPQPVLPEREPWEQAGE